MVPALKESGAQLRHTRSPCPVCKRVIPAEIVEIQGGVWMRKECPEHGGFELPVSRDVEFYKFVMERVGPSPNPPDRALSSSEFGPLRGVCLDLTQRCDLHCANCFSNANVQLKPDLSMKDVIDVVARFTGRPPVVFLQGGEPTLHPELPGIIRALVDRGCVPKLVTNGLRLTDRTYVNTLKEAGLDWIFFQFDGFDDETYQVFRGSKLLDKKLAALGLLNEIGFSVLLAVMVEREYNLAQVGRILQYAFEAPSVRQISFLPGSRQGRNSLTPDAIRTEPIDVMDAMEKATGGGVTRKDFLEFLGIAKTLFRLTGNPDYKPKSCFFPMILYRDNGRIYGLNRILNPVFSLKHPGAPFSALRMAMRIGRLDNAPPDPRLMLICIEHFREMATLDIEDARHCNKVFLDEEGYFVQGCIYNCLYRR